MAGGFNTDVVSDGALLHVQSEDRGVESAVLETLVYCGGQVLHQERSSYADLAAAGGDPEEIHRRLERQHRDVLRRSRHGEFAPASDAGADPEDAEQLAGAIREFLAGEALFAPLAVRFVPCSDEALSGQLQVRQSRDGAPVAGAKIEAWLVGPGLAPLSVWSGLTGPLGDADVAAALPGPARGAVIFRVEHGTARGRLRLELAGPDGTWVHKPGTSDAVLVAR